MIRALSLADDSGQSVLPSADSFSSPLILSSAFVISDLSLVDSSINASRSLCNACFCLLNSPKLSPFPFDLLLDFSHNLVKLSISTKNTDRVYTTGYSIGADELEKTTFVSLNCFT